ncbi:16S rRNA (adenine(1518)-N(6)/adenine(1519)-N(6))-dimethyltransferase RsmA ['Cynodon dactylon' phytoplasma]|uniref:16S rRNA (adenine(1518)-N(6)/adenine(1519)-N(6))- dimethyltransferase RsmA n=1 Tax='Cynodon dactylon' phytoplasma TaxID=295320 RepID=UPI001265CFEB|nr:16S rRNA (adenine(1518)-N(6)/adenine(1519)-N(6))-dimethyltransferase RsmA ['Cynodon dactylon' phytoplasma]KAB8122072.1 ribosomal RNA small subunit methyltransferase A ['Cynodon dactylon' phytoplasma]
MTHKHLFKKKYGQNFLTDINLLKSILQKEDVENKNVVEVGTGKGIFTRLIAQKAKKVLTYEIDNSLKPFLDFSNYDNIFIIYDDILKRDLIKDFHQYFGKENVYMVGNLPYHITSSLIFKILFLDQVPQFTFLMQKEMGLRILSEGHKNSFLSIFLQSLTKIIKIKYIKNTMFFPKPKVDGIILKFKKFSLDEKEKLFIKNEFFLFTKASFYQKRKKLINNISNYFSLPKNKVFLFFQKYQISIDIRAEQMNVAEFKKISFLFFNFFNQYDIKSSQKIKI